jgi:hypothetical protein
VGMNWPTESGPKRTASLAGRLTMSCWLIVLAHREQRLKL